jgi:hypothetical protein
MALETTVVFRRRERDAGMQYVVPVARGAWTMDFKLFSKGPVTMFGATTNLQSTFIKMTKRMVFTTRLLS